VTEKTALNHAKNPWGNESVQEEEVRIERGKWSRTNRASYMGPPVVTERRGLSPLSTDRRPEKVGRFVLQGGIPRFKGKRENSQT